MLQVIKAEDVRDGEPRWWCPDDAYAARTLEWIVTGNLHTEWRRDADAFTLAIVDRPAPTPTPAPGLDLDAVERAERAMTPGPWHVHVLPSSPASGLLVFDVGPSDDHSIATTSGTDTESIDEAEANAHGLVALRNAAPALIAEVRRLRALVDEREADMHARIRAGYDKTVADAWRAEVAKRDAEIADLRALVESQRRDYLDVCDAIAPETSGPADAAAKVRALRAKLAEAKRLGLIAARVVLDDDTDLPAIAAPRVAPSPTPGICAAIEQAAAWIELGELGGTPDAVALVATLREFARTPRAATVARPIAEWHEDHGPALWWQFPVDEPPYSGSPLDDDWPGYHTHWTPIVCPDDPASRGPIGEG